MSTISNITISAFLALLASLGIGGTGTSQFASISGAGSGLVAHYTFDEGTATDSSGNGNNGVLGGNVTFSVGKIGQAINISSNGEVLLNDKSGLDFSQENAFTISAWVYPTGNSAQEVIFSRGSTGSSASNESYYLQRYSDGGVFGRISDGTNRVSVSAPSNTLTVGSWHYITFSWDGTNLSLYKNNSLIASSNSIGLSIKMDVSGEASIGADGRSERYYFNGSLDDLRIYSRALSASEISELYAYTGSGGGSTSPTNGVCGSSNNVCTSGSLSDTSDTSSQYLWQCTGTNGGSTASCSQPIPVTTYTLSITKSGTGSGTVTSTSINCGSTCSQSNIANNTQITLTATPQSGSTFTGWSGGSCSGTGTCTTTITANTTVTANFTSSAVAGTCPSISQYGITWTFASSVNCGQFANGDWWVVGPVTITNITPASTLISGRTMNGSMVNPLAKPFAPNGFDSTLGSYQSALNRARPNGNDLSVSNPLVLPANSSLISSISIPTPANRPQLSDAAVLTVLPSVAPLGSFRPPYQGTDKTLYWNKSNLNYSILKSLPVVTGTPSLSSVENSFIRPWIEIDTQYSGREFHPENNQPIYGRDMSFALGNGLLSLHLNYSNAQKELLFVRLVQYGLDVYGAAKTGGDWQANGGHDHGRKMPLILAGLALNDVNILNYGDKSKHFIFQEDQQTWIVTSADVGRYVKDQSDIGRPRITYGPEHVGLAEWGITHSGSPDSDGSNWGVIYRNVVYTSITNHALAAHLTSGAVAVWNWPPFFQYIDRVKTIASPAEFSSFSNNMWTSYRTGSGDSSTINAFCATTLNQCVLGSFSDQTDSGTQYLWQCLGSNGGTTASCSQTIPVVDTTLPTISMTSPNNGATVSGASVSIAATASDNIGVVGVQFKLDGANLSSELTTAPYSGTWNTTGVSNGIHTLTAVARDLAGNTKTSSSVTVTVNNTVAPAPSTPTTPTPSTSTTPSSGGGGGSSSSSSSSSGGSSSPVSVPSTGTLTPTVPQKPLVTTTTTTCKATTQLGQLVELLISLGLIRQDRVDAARSYSCTSTTTNTSSSVTSGTKFTLALDIGARNTEVTALQTYLISQGLLQTKATGYFGPATAKAVGLFQQKYNLSTPGSPSYGFVGPKTRAKLNELVK